MDHPHMGWQCPCCRKVYAPSVIECVPCSGIVTTTPGTLPYVAPFVAPTVIWPIDGTRNPTFPPYEATCDSFRMEARTDGWMINGEFAQISNTGETH